jgi:RecB family exonuclease
MTQLPLPMAELRLTVTPHGRPAAEALRERVAAAKADDPLSPVTVLVPTNYVGVSVRRLLATGALGPVATRGAGIAGLTLLTVYRLAELLGAAALAATGRRPVSTPLVGAAVRHVLSVEPGIFAPVAGHPSTEQALVRAHRELSELRPRTLALLGRQGRRTADVVRIHRAVRDRLAADWYEEADLMAAALQTVSKGSAGEGERQRAGGWGSAVLDDLGAVIVYMPEALSLPAADLLRAISGVTTVEVVAALTGADQADADVVRTLRRLGLSSPAPPDVAPPEVSEVVSVSDAEEEVRSAVSRVIAQARTGVPLERMAILYPEPEPYARILHEQLAAAGITYNGAAAGPLTERLVGRWLLDLLELPARDYDRPAVMGLLTSAPVVDDRGRWIPAGTWERISRDAGIVRGRDEWRAKLERYAADQRRRADEPAEDTPDWLIERRRTNAELADRLRAFASALIAALDEAARLRRWSALAGWCRRMLARRIERRRDRWPQSERDAADRVDETLDRLAALDAAEPATDLPTFGRALRIELEDDLGRVGRLGHGVLVGTPWFALGVDLDVVILLGMAEGVTPARPREDSLLPDAERRVVADELPPRDERVGVQHRHLLAALCGAHTHRIMIHPRGDLRRSIERAPSRWLLDSVAARADEAGGGRALPDRAGWLETVPSFADRMRRTSFPATHQEYRLRQLAAGRDRAHPASHPMLAADPILRRGVELLRQRRDGVFGRFTGRLTGAAAQLVAAAVERRVLSATALEAWLSCPHAFLLQHVLRVEPVDNPEELLRIDALEQGSLVHDVLEGWLCELLDGALPAATDAWPSAARDRLRELAEQACHDAEARGVTGHPLLWRRDRRRLLLDFEQFLARDDERRAALRLTPVSSELAFGMAYGSEPLSVDLGDGRSLRLRGRVDRVDRAEDGAIVVADYKTGGAFRYRDLTVETPLADGTKLQLPIYGLAVQSAHPDAPEIHIEYWFVSSKARWERIGYPLTTDVVERLRHTLRIVVDGMATGLFPQRPPAPVWRRWPECDFCDPDGLGTSERYREWERIRLDPTLRDYLSLVEPDALAEPDAS